MSGPDPAGTGRVGGRSNLQGKEIQATNTLPLLVASILGGLWAGLYLIAGSLHGMWPMFNRKFPFLIASLLHLRPEAISSRLGALLTFADGASVTFVVAWLLLGVVRHGSQLTGREGE